MERSSVWGNDAREAQWLCTRMIKWISCHCCFILSRDTRFYYTHWINFLLFSFFYSPTFISLTVMIQLSSCTSKTVIFELCSLAGVRRLILVPPLLSPQMEFWEWRRRRERSLTTYISLPHFFFFKIFSSLEGKWQISAMKIEDISYTHIVL